MQSDYLKYWRVVRQFIKAKHKLTQADLDILLFLKSEQYFSKDKFKEFDELISWNKNRFENLRQAGSNITVVPGILTKHPCPRIHGKP